MRLYLSSFREGARTDALRTLVAPGGLVAVSVNALDNQAPTTRTKIFEREEQALTALGYRTTELDLRVFFGQAARLGSALDTHALVWCSGGNAFVLRLAMKLSGFDALITERLRDDTIAYGGYSAGAVVAGASLDALNLVDRTDDMPSDYPSRELLFDGLGLVPYVLVPHYRSDHSESVAMEKVVALLQQRGLPYKTLRDGEVDVHGLL